MLVADGARVMLSAPHEATAASATERLDRYAPTGEDSAGSRVAWVVADNADPELGPAGIRINGVLPVRIATDRVRELDARKGDPDEVRARLSEHIPLRRYGEPEEFGRVAAFLLSPAASYLTGAMIPVDGGAISSI